MKIGDILADEMIDFSFFPVLFPSTSFIFDLCFIFGIFALAFCITVILGRRDISYRRIQPDVEVFHFTAFFLAVGNLKTKVRCISRNTPIF